MSTARKIRFVEPGSRPGRPFNAWIQRWPLLGPITLASLLEQRGFDVQVYNENISGPLADNPPAYQDVSSADVVGISVMTPTAARGYAIADRLRRDGSAATIVFGGVHATFRPQEVLAHGDVVVCGEGESVIEAIARGDVAGGILRAEPVQDLDSLPTLNHALMRDFDRLAVAPRCRDLYELPVMTSRGCPFGCTYCSVTRMFGRRVRRQSVGAVVRDLHRYAQRGFRRVFFYDDNFTTDRDWTRRLLERMRPLGLRFNAQARIDFHWLDRARRRRDEPLLRELRRAGGDVLYIGYETIDEGTARQWNKGYVGGRPLAARLAEDTRILHDSGFWIHGMFVLGPQHTRQTAGRIVQFARDNGIETIQISILTPFPGTPLLEAMQPHLLFTEFPSDWDYFDGTHCVYDHARLAPAEFQHVVLEAHRRFYQWGGWSARRARGLLEGRLNAWTKLRNLWNNARTARRTLTAWRRETREFLRVLEERLRRRLARPAAEAVQPDGPPADGVYVPSRLSRPGAAPAAAVTARNPAPGG